MSTQCQSLVASLLRKSGRSARLKMRTYAKLWREEIKVRPRAAREYLAIATTLRDSSLRFLRQAAFVENGGVR